MDTWTDRDAPVLQAIAELYDEQGEANEDEIMERTGFDQTTVRRAVRALLGEDPPYFEASPSMDGDFGIIVNVTGHGRRAAGQWPTSERLADRITEAFAEVADHTDDEEQRSWLRRAGAWFGNAGRDVIVEVAAAVLAKQTGAS